MGKIYKNDVGVIIKIDTGIDLSECGSVKMLVRTPTADVEWNATLVAGASSQIEYTTKEGDLSEAGDYLIQSYVIMGDNSVHRGETATLTVYDYFE